MVLVENTPSFARAWQVHPDLRRSLAYAGAIALNFALLLLVSLPMPVGKTVVLVRPPEVVTQVVPVEKEKQPPPKPPMVPVTVREIPHPQVPLAHTRAPTPPVDVAVLVPDGSEAVLGSETPPTDTTPTVTGPVTGMSLEYASAPAPSYPRAALREGITGTVFLEVLVGIDGSPLKVTIHRSSGHRELDRAAQLQVQKHWRFRPASRNGTAVQAIGIVPIDFKLD